MSEESKSNAPVAPAPLGEIEHGPSQFDQFMEKNLKKLILLALLIVIGVAAFVITSQLADAKAREAGNALLAAESPDDLRKVSQDYPDTGAGASAQLLLAGQLWDEGKEDEATAVLKSLASSDEDLAAAQAKFALAGMQFKQGKTDEAKANYEGILSNSDAKYLHPMSLVALGDIAEAAGEEEKAKEYFQRKLDDYPAYADQNMAITRLNLVGVDAPDKVSPPPAPATPPASTDGIPSSFTDPIAIPNPNTPTGAPAIELEPAMPVTREENAPEQDAAEDEMGEEPDSTEASEEEPPASAPVTEGETPTFEAPAPEEE